MLCVFIQSCVTSGNVTEVQVKSTNLKPLIGEWRRSTGGYSLTIKDSNGKIGVSYYSPSQGFIYVSKSIISDEDQKIRVEVTLTDRNYPDNKYVLVYHEEVDSLYGFYEYPEKTLPVNFTRVK
jgi:hypothetical protein